MKFKALIGVATGKFSTWSLKITNNYIITLHHMGNICRDLHLLLDTLDIQLTKLGKTVVHISKLFILEALKTRLFVTHHKYLF